MESENARDQIKNAKLNLENAQLAASMAADSLDDYNIDSQITGTVIEKNFKAGDQGGGHELRLPGRDLRHELSEG